MIEYRLPTHPDISETAYMVNVARYAGRLMEDAQFHYDNAVIRMQSDHPSVAAQAYIDADLAEADMMRISLIERHVDEAFRTLLDQQ